MAASCATVGEDKKKVRRPIAQDAPPCKTLLENLQPGQHVLADQAYDADWIRCMICEQGATCVIPPKANRKLPAEFDTEIYRERN